MILKMLNSLTALVTASCLLLPTRGAIFNFRSFRRTKDSIYSCPNYPLPTADPARLASELQPFLLQIVEEVNSTLRDYKSPGAVAIGLVYNQNLLWTKGFGLKDGQDPTQGPPDADTAFRIGSITKLFTSLMMFQYRDEKLLSSINDELTEYLPELQIQNPFHTRRSSTFKQLASHMSGFPRDIPCPNMFVTGCNMSAADLYRNIANLSLIRPPGLEPIYSNMGFGAIGRALEKIQGPTWEYQLQKRVLQPLGMSHSGTEFTDQVKKYLAVGYNQDGREAALIDIGWERPAGQMYSSVRDLSELMMMTFKRNASYDPAAQVLDGVTIGEWLQPAYVYHDRTGFAHPWEIVPLGNYSLKTKDGAINGYLSEIMMAPEINTGVIVLQSCECDSFESIVSTASSMITEVSRLLYSLQTNPPLPPSPAEYVGSYAFIQPGIPQAQAVVTIYQEEIQEGYSPLIAMEVVSSSVGELGLLQWIARDQFQITTQGLEHDCSMLGNGVMGEYVFFQRDSPNGRITSFTIPGMFYGASFVKK